jgi:hypothetical protein
VFLPKDTPSSDATLIGMLTIESTQALHADGVPPVVDDAAPLVTSADLARWAALDLIDRARQDMLSGRSWEHHPNYPCD